MVLFVIDDSDELKKKIIYYGCDILFVIHELCDTWIVWFIDCVKYGLYEVHRLSDTWITWNS